MNDKSDNKQQARRHQRALNLIKRWRLMDDDFMKRLKSAIGETDAFYGFEGPVPPIDVGYVRNAARAVVQAIVQDAVSRVLDDAQRQVADVSTGRLDVERPAGAGLDEHHDE